MEVISLIVDEKQNSILFLWGVFEIILFIYIFIKLVVLCLSKCYLIFHPYTDEYENVDKIINI